MRILSDPVWRFYVLVYSLYVAVVLSGLSFFLRGVLVNQNDAISSALGLFVIALFTFTIASAVVEYYSREKHVSKFAFFSSSIASLFSILLFSLFFNWDDIMYLILAISVFWVTGLSAFIPVILVEIFRRLEKEVLAKALIVHFFLYLIILPLLPLITEYIGWYLLVVSFPYLSFGLRASFMDFINKYYPRGVRYLNIASYIIAAISVIFTITPIEKVLLGFIINKVVSTSSLFLSLLIASASIYDNGKLR